MRARLLQHCLRKQLENQRRAQTLEHAIAYTKRLNKALAEWDSLSLLTAYSNKIITMLMAEKQEAVARARRWKKVASWLKK